MSGQQPFNVRSEILSAIAKTNDENLKMILLLMLGVLEEIGGKIDAAMIEEHIPKHNQHHDWVEQRINHQGRCEWANRKIEAERLAAETKTGMFRKFLEAIAGQLGLIVVTALAVAFGLGQFNK